MESGSPVCDTFINKLANQQVSYLFNYKSMVPSKTGVWRKKIHEIYVMVVLLIIIASSAKWCVLYGYYMYYLNFP